MTASDCVGSPVPALLTGAVLRAWCQVVSDQSINFPHTGRVNYEDPNYNVQLPIFRCLASALNQHTEPAHCFDD